MYGRSKLTIHESIEEGRELGGPGDRELQFEDEEDEPVGGGGMGGFQSQGNRSLLLVLLHRFLNSSLYTELRIIIICTACQGVLQLLRDQRPGHPGDV